MSEENINSRLVVTTRNINYYEYYLGDLTDRTDHLDLVKALRASNEGDTCRIYINSNGGLTSSAVQIRTAILESMAHVITRAEGDCCSAGTMVLLSGHEIEIVPNTVFMVHEASFGYYGKQFENKSFVDYYHDLNKTMLEDIYKGFLTEEEMERVLRGEDLWIRESSYEERLTNFFNERNKDGEEGQLETQTEPVLNLQD